MYTTSYHFSNVRVVELKKMNGHRVHIEMTSNGGIS